MHSVLLYCRPMHRFLTVLANPHKMLLFLVTISNLLPPEAKATAKNVVHARRKLGTTGLGWKKRRLPCSSCVLA